MSPAAKPGYSCPEPRTGIQVEEEAAMPMPSEKTLGTATPDGMPTGEEVQPPPSVEIGIAPELEVDPAGSGTSAREGCPLSPREREILELVSTGMRNPEIARSLGVAPCTIATHMKSVSRKLGARSRPHAVRIALLSGEIGPAARGRQAVPDHFRAMSPIG
jgi:DNA-binding CsgD family transcriptional regulator